MASSPTGGSSANIMAWRRLSPRRRLSEALSPKRCPSSAVWPAYPKPNSDATLRNNRSLDTGTSEEHPVYTKPAGYLSRGRHFARTSAWASEISPGFDSLRPLSEPPHIFYKMRPQQSSFCGLSTRLPWPSMTSDLAPATPIPLLCATLHNARAAFCRKDNRPHQLIAPDIQRTELWMSWSQDAPVHPGGQIMDGADFQRPPSLSRGYSPLSRYSPKPLRTGQA